MTYADWINPPHYYFQQEKIMFDEESWPFTNQAGTLTTNLSRFISEIINIGENKRQ